MKPIAYARNRCNASAARGLSYGSQTHPAGDIGAVSLQIGLIGFADALHLLGLRYDSDDAREQALSMVKVMSEGCLAATVDLAADRGASQTGRDVVIRRCLRRNLGTELVKEIRRRGIRHRNLTAIDSHRSLALLANNVADALDPLTGPDRVYSVETALGTRSIQPSGAAIAFTRQRNVPDTAFPIDTIADVPVDAQRAVRATLQSWVDSPIDCPIATAEPVRIVSIGEAGINRRHR